MLSAMCGDADAYELAIKFHTSLGIQRNLVKQKQQKFTATMVSWMRSRTDR